MTGTAPAWTTQTSNKLNNDLLTGPLFGAPSLGFTTNVGGIPEVVVQCMQVLNKSFIISTNCNALKTSGFS